MLDINIVSTNYTTKATLTPNEYYKFKVESRNSFGYSIAMSNEVTILAARVPDAPINLLNKAEITAAGVIGISWSDGAYDGGSPVIDYKISS